MDEIIKQSKLFENDHVKKWKSQGGRVLGYICVATPTEIIEAAGILPYRVRALGSSQTEIADAHLSRFNCSFCRSCLQLGLEGKFDFLDGMIETNGCDHLRGMIENWHYAKKFDFLHYLRVPHVNDKNSMAFFEEELGLFKKAIEDRFGSAIKDEAIWDQIKKQESIRARLRTIYEIRERKEPGFTGADALSILLIASAVPSDALDAMLSRAIEERKDKKLTGYRARLLLAGSVTDELDFVKEIESMGGLVVTDALCYGSRAFWTQSAEKDGDPVKFLARMYLEKLMCPRMFDDFPARRDFVLSAVERAKVDGVVLVHNKFCDVHGVDNVQLRLALEKKGVLVLQLEKEYGAKADMGRLKTRVQAFLERIGGR